MNKQSQPTHNSGHASDVLPRQGLRLPRAVLKRLRDAGIYCQPTVSIEHHNLAKNYVLRGVESGGAIADLGEYSSFVGDGGEALSWLQRVDSIGVNGVHAVAVAPMLVRLQMLRIERTYDLLITRHSLTESVNGKRPQLVSSVLFYGRRGNLELEFWGTDAAFRGTVCPIFYTRAGENARLPERFQVAVTRITAAVCCLRCRHCHLLCPKMVAEVPGAEPSVSQDWAASPSGA